MIVRAGVQRRAVDVRAEIDTVAELVEQAPFEAAQNGFDPRRPDQAGERGDVMIVEFRMRIFPRQQLEQQLQPARRR
jgi:hypothetical protein